MLIAGTPTDVDETEFLQHISRIAATYQLPQNTSLRLFSLSIHKRSDVL